MEKIDKYRSDKLERTSFIHKQCFKIKDLEKKLKQNHKRINSLEETIKKINQI